MTLFSQIPLLPFFSIREVTIAASTLGNLILEPDWRRVAFIIQNLGVNEVTIRPKIAAQIGVGLSLSSGAIPLEFKFKDYGTLTTLSWFAIADIMDSDIIIYETLYAPLQQTNQGI